MIYSDILLNIYHRSNPVNKAQISQLLLTCYNNKNTTCGDCRKKECLDYQSNEVGLIEIQNEDNKSNPLQSYYTHITKFVKNIQIPDTI